MSTTARTRRLELAAAERRVAEHLKRPEAPAPVARRAVILVAALVLFAATFAARLAIHDPDALLANFYVVPIALLAVEFGTRAGVLAAVVAMGLVAAWTAIETVHIGVLGYSSRGAALLVSGVLVGVFSERLRDDIAQRQQAQRHLGLYADELERANRELAQSVERLEAFAEIARAVGGETDLERVLSLILRHGRETVAARELVFYLPERGQLYALRAEANTIQRGRPLALEQSLAGDVFLGGRPRRVSYETEEISQLDEDAQTAMLVPLRFRGEVLGVLAAIDSEAGEPFEDEDEQLLLSVAASAATAVATARSVAATRLRESLEAADQARARWARELHDGTLQGLTGARMLLSAGLARGDTAALRSSAQNADAHLGEEIRNLRDLIAELRPAALDDVGLRAAIESLAKRQAAIGAFGVELELDLPSNGGLTRDTETATYRIVQEALSNAVKHAHAARVSVVVRRLTECLEIKVQDDGRGFEPGSPVDGFGLAGMRERALLAGGRLAVSSCDGGPTCVTAVLPLAEAAAPSTTGIS